MIIKGVQKIDKQLRLLSCEIIVESDMSKSSKIHLLNFIKEDETDAQIKALLMDGKIVKLDEQAEEIVNDRFEISEAGGRVAKLRKSVMSVVAVTSLYGIPYLIYRTIRSSFDHCTERCGTYELNTSRRQHCMLKCKVDKYEKMVKSAKQKDLTPKEKISLNKLKGRLIKAQHALKKSIQSFKDRGAQTPAE